MNHGITKNKKNFQNNEKKKHAWYYEQQLLGLNYRMTDVAATMGISQIKRLNKFVKARNKIAKIYNKSLDKNFLILPPTEDNVLSSFHLYVVKVKDESSFLHEKLFNYLRKKKININLHYIPVHLHPYYKKLGFKKGDYKSSEKHSSSAISLPIYPNLKEKKVRDIAKLINNFYKKIKK